MESYVHVPGFGDTREEPARSGTESLVKASLRSVVKEDNDRGQM